MHIVIFPMLVCFEAEKAANDAFNGAHSIPIVVQ